MTVTKDITRQEKSSLKLSITIGKDDINLEYNELLSNYSKSIQMPGFRKGKVPKEVFLRKFGDALKEEALGKIIEKSVESVFSDETFPRENKPLPYSTPKVEDEPKLDLEKDLSFSVVYDVLPEVKIEKWQGYTAEIPDVSIGEEDLARELDVLRERNSIVLDKNDDEPALEGDVVTVNYCELDEEGAAIPGSDRDDFTYTLGSGNNAYRFDKEITGIKKGETREFTKTYSGDDEDYPGKTKKLKVTLTSLKTKKLPDLDDDLAQDVDEKFKTLEDLKDNIRKRLDKELAQKLKNLKINSLLEQIMEKTPVEIPESMLRLELDSRWRNLARRFNTDSNGLYKILGSTPNNAESIIEEWKPDAVKALHSRLIVETLIEELKLSATEEEVENELERMAEDSQTTKEEIKKYYEEGQMMEYLSEEIKENKFFDILLDKNTIQTGKKTRYIDLVSNKV